MSICRWPQNARLAKPPIALGKPTQDAFVENLSARLRDELLSETLFT
jgi:hypothetical protein